MTTIESTNQDMYQTIADDSSITVIEKQVGRTTTTDISEALEEYKRLFKAGIASDAETLTLSRAYPNDSVYRDAASRIETEPVVVGGPASVSLIDREGHLITTDALEKAFKQYMSNFRTRNTMVLHSDVQVGWALPAYISKSGDVFKSGVDEKGLFFVTEIRNDTKIAKKVLDQIDDGKLKSYSIAGSATKTQNKTKGLMPYMQVDEMELAEITVCERGVNQAASFDILKGHDAATHTCTDGSCLMDNPTPTPKEPLELIMKADGNIDFVNTFSGWVEKGPIVNIAQRALSGAKKVERGATAAMSTPRRVGAGAKAATSSIIGRATTTKKGERQRAKYGQPAKRPAQGAIGSAISGFKATPPSTQAMQRAKRISSIRSSNAQKGSTSPATVAVHPSVSDGSAARNYMASRPSNPRSTAKTLLSGAKKVVQTVDKVGKKLITDPTAKARRFQSAKKAGLTRAGSQAGMAQRQAESRAAAQRAGSTTPSTVKRGQALRPTWAKGKTQRQTMIDARSKGGQARYTKLDYDLEKAGEIDKFSPSVARLTGRKRAQAIKAHNYPVRSVPEELKARYDRAGRRLENTKPENVRARATQDRILRSGKNKNLTGPILPTNQQNKDYDLEKAGMSPALQNLVIDSSKKPGSEGVKAGRRGAWAARRHIEEIKRNYPTLAAEGARRAAQKIQRTKQDSGLGSPRPQSRTTAGAKPWKPSSAQAQTSKTQRRLTGWDTSKDYDLEKADKKRLGSGKPLKWVEPQSAQYGPKTNDSKTNRSKTIRPGKPLIWHDVEPGSIQKGAFLAPLAAIGRTAATGVGRAASAGAKATGKAVEAGSKKGGKMALDYGKRKAQEKIEDKVSSIADKLFGSKKEKMVDTNISLLADFVAKANYTPGAGKKSPMAAPEDEPNIGKVVHEQHDQDQKDSENAFTLQDKETEVAFQKDDESAKPEGTLVTEYSTEQIEKDTELVMADSQVPSTPSMGWFDMLKEELKADVLTDIEMTKSYPDWQQDPESYSEHREIIKNKITEGYK